MLIFKLITEKSKQLIELLLPAQCLVCALKSNNKLICHYCEKMILSERAYCLHCALPLSKTSDYCGDCLKKNYSFTHIHALGDYKKPLSMLIKQLKYQQQLIAGELLAYLLTKSILSRYTKQQLIQFDYLLPVPLHIKKLQQRGFNQTKIICDQLSKFLTISLLDDHIIRAKETIAQEGLSIEKRRRNLVNAFSINKASTTGITGKNIVIIDDVVTTGATINSLCKLLEKEGANSISIFCISRTAINK